MRSARRGCAATTRSRCRRCRSPASSCSGRRSSTTSRAACTVSDQGVTASGVTLFVPMSVVTGSSNNVYGIDNDIGYVVWQRQFDARAARTDGALSRRYQRRRDAHREARRNGLELAGVRRRARSGRLSQRGRRARARRAGRGTGGGAGRAAAIRRRRSAAPGRGGGRGARSRCTSPPPPPGPGARGGQPDDRIPGSPRATEAAAHSAACRDPRASAT